MLHPLLHHSGPSPAADPAEVKAVYRAVRMDHCDWQRTASIRSTNEEDLALSKKFGQERVHTGDILKAWGRS